MSGLEGNKLAHIRRRVLITGGAGFIGTELSRRIDPADEVLILDSLHPQVHQDEKALDGFPANVTFIRGDVTDPQAAKMAAEFRPTTLVHLAAETGTGQSLRESRRHVHVNVTGTASILDALSSIEWCPNSIVLTSSRAVYGEGAWLADESSSRYYGRPRTASQLEDADWSPRGPNGESGSPAAHDARIVEPRPSNVYAATKLAQENVLSAWCTAFEVPLSILRLQNVYGVGQAVQNSYTGVLTYFASQAVKGEQLRVFEGGGILRDFVHVRDVADALLEAMMRPPVDLGKRVIDIGSGQPITLFDIASLIGDELPLITNQYRLGDVRAAFADTRVAEEQLDYRPKVALRDGIVELKSWVREQLKL